MTDLVVSRENSEAKGRRMMMWDIVLFILRTAQHPQVESTVVGNIAYLPSSKDTSGDIGNSMWLQCSRAKLCEGKGLEMKKHCV